MTHEEYKEMLAAYALGALDSVEASEFERHLAACPECEAETADWREGVAMLSLSAPPVEPSTALRARILEQIRMSPQSTGKALEDDKGSSAAEGEAQTGSNVIEMRPRERRTGWSTGLKFGAIAASIAIIGLALSLLLVWKRMNNMQRELEREHTAVEVLAKRAAEEREAREFLTSPGVKTALLSGKGQAQQATARLALDPATGRAMMFAYNLPSAPAGKAYQLWFIADPKHPIPGGVFNTDAEGRSVMHDQVPAAGRNASVFAVTLEPAGGVAAPTGDIYLVTPTS